MKTIKTIIVVMFLILITHTATNAGGFRNYRESNIFSVTVPMSLPISVDSDGDVYTSNSAKIQNNGLLPVIVENLIVEPLNGWTVNDYDTTYYDKKVNLKEFGIRINGDDVSPDGYLELNEEISPGGDLRLNYSATVAVQTEPIEERIANVIFTVNWSEYPEFYKAEFTAGNNGRLQGGPKVITDILKGTVITFPTAIPDNNYVFSYWKDTDTGREVFEEDPVYSNMYIQALFEFKVSGGPVQTIGNYKYNLETGTIQEYVGPTPIGNLTSIPTSVTIEGTTFTIENIGNNVFANKGITSLTIPNGIVTIGVGAFQDNNMNGSTLAIPNSVREIGSDAFQNNRIHKNNLTIDNTRGNVQIGTGAFAGNHANGKTDIINDIRYLR